MRLLSDLAGTLRNAFRVARATLDASSLTTERTVTLPDKSGTVAMLDDVISGDWRVVTAAETLAAADPIVADLPATGTDPLWASVISLLRFNGTNGSTTFTDDTGLRTWTANGNAQISTTTPRNGTGCGLFDGTGDGLTPTNAADFALGTGDFSIELDVRIGGALSANQVLFLSGATTASSGSFYIGLTAPRLVSVYSYVSNATLITSSISLTDNTWHRIEVSRSGNVLRLFVDGALAGSISNTQNFTAGTAARVGMVSDGTFSFNGRMDNFRVTKGVARNSAAYVVDTAEPATTLGIGSVTFPLPTTVEAGQVFVLRNAASSQSLAVVDPGAGRQIHGFAVAATVAIPPGDQVELVARTTTIFDLIARNPAGADIPVRTVTAATNFLLSDRGGCVRKDNTSALTWTILNDATSGWSTNVSIVVANDGSSGNVTITPGSGVTLTAGTTSGSFTLAPGESRLLHRAAANNWRIR